MNKLYAAAALLCLAYFNLNAQQIPLFTQYRETQGIVNPAAINYDYFTDRHQTSFGLSFRRQWLDMTNPPTTQVLRGEYFAADRSGVAILAGGYLLRDQTGPTGYTGVYGRFATVFTEDAAYSGLSIGINAGAVQYGVRTSQLKLRDEGDIRASEDRTQTHPDIGAGVFYYRQMEGALEGDYFYAGASVPQMLGFDLNFASNEGNFNLKRVQHFYSTIGLYHFIGENSFVEPSALVKYTPNAPVNVDLNIRYQMSSSFWVGVGSSLRGNLHVETGFVLGKSLGLSNNLKFGYGFDYSFQTYGPHVGTTHEVNLAVSF
jgi:type IX secretion system PorP/SprF family membrane protein